MSDTVIADLLAALRMAERLFAEALPKFNWGASALDANAIQLLNDVPSIVHAALVKAELMCPVSGHVAVPTQYIRGLDSRESWSVACPACAVSFADLTYTGLARRWNEWHRAQKG